jgi:M6 family metalloprotease-like protein
MSRLLVRVILPLVLLSLAAHAVSSAPLHFVPQRLSQPDGRVLECFASGDEYYNWLHDANGYTIIQDQRTGWYVYAELQSGVLVASRYVPGKDLPEAHGIAPWLRMSETQIASLRGVFRKPPAGEPPVQLSAPTKGTVNNLVVFIRFSDEAEYTDSLTLYQSMCNATAGNSMLAYFREASYNQLTIQTSFFPASPSVVVRSYKDSLPRSYYQPYSTTNTNGYGSDQMARETALLVRAINAVAADVPDTLVIDSDKDGTIDNVCFVVSGQPTAWATLLWPHMSALGSSAATIRGARVGTYNFQLQSSLKSSGVGVLCHEMFHSLGSPDLYHYNHNGMSPVARWDIMEQDGNPPQHMGAHMKWRYGKWIATMPEITAPGTYTLNPLTSPTNNCYRIKSPYSTTEYFAVEYRRKAGLFEGTLPGDGLLVYRINTAYRGNASGPPDEVYIYRPGGTLTANGTPDLAFFSATSGRKAINDNTNPSSFLSTGKKGGLNISNVTAAGATISFDVVLDTQSVQLASPLKNAQWIIGETKRIGWTTFGLPRTMKVEYSIDSGVTYMPVVSTGRTSWYWQVPNTPSAECRMRITDQNNAGVRDSVDFVICPPFYRSQFNYDVTDTTKARDHAGILFFQGEFWTSRASSDQYYRWTPEGEIIEEFYISGTAAMKAMTTDGQFVYGATGSNRLPKIDAQNRMRIELIMAPVKAQFITYDPTAAQGQGGFWIGEPGSDLVLVDRTGKELRRIAYAAFDIPNVTGIAYDDYTAGAPYLWLFSKGAGAGNPQYLWRLRLSDGTRTELFHDVLQDIGSTSVDGLAGGLTIAQGVIPGRVSLCGTLLGTPNRLFGYEFPDTETVLLLEENVAYPPGGKASDHGWTASEFEGLRPIRVADFGLYYPNYASSNIGRSLRVEGDESPRENLAKSFARQTDHSVYAAALVHVDTASKAPSIVFTLSPENTGNAASCSVAVKQLDAGRIAFGLAKSTVASEAVFSDSACYPRSTYLVVVKYSFRPGAADDSISLWIDPVINGHEPPPSVRLRPSSADAPDISAVTLLQANMPAYSARVDGIRVATAWDRAVAPGRAWFDRSVLVIDETDESAAPFSAAGITDSAVDAFYWDAFLPSATWDYAAQGLPPRELLRHHQLVIWHADHPAETAPHVVARPDVVEMLQDYLDAGGKLIVCGWRVVKSFDWSKTPPLSFKSGSFVYDYLHVQESDETPMDGDCIGAATTDASYHAMTVDSTKLRGAPFNGKLSRVEVFRALADSTTILLRYRNDAASPNQQYAGMPVALRNRNPLSETVLLGFPLSFMRRDEAILFAADILRQLGVSAIPTGTGFTPVLPDAIAVLEPNFPNPVAAHTTIPFVLREAGHVRIAIINALGQEVALLVDAYRPAGRYATRVNGGLAPGVYFVRLVFDPSPAGKATCVIGRSMLVLR